MSWLDDFKSFVLRGSLVDLAIGFTVGAAFSTVAKSLVNDVLMPPIGLLLGGTDFSNLFIVLKRGTEDEGPYQTVAEAAEAGAVTLNYGQFVNAVLALLIVAVAMFVLIRMIARVERSLEQTFGDDKQEETPSSKKCPFCRTTISYQAARCPNCTSHLDGSDPASPPASLPSGA